MKESSFRATIMRDIAVLVLLLWTFALALIVTLAPDDKRTIYMVAMLAMDAAVLVGYVGKISLCVVLSGTLTCVWVSYKLYMFYALGELIAVSDFAMIPLPLLGAVDATLFQNGIKHMDAENTMLRRQVEELVLIDEVTGLYNLRAMYSDLRIMSRYCERNDQPISLMIVQMRYEQELHSMLSARRYIELRQRLVDVLSENKRLEDRLYNIDENGTMALLLTTNEKNSEIVRNRMLAAAAREGAFDGILDNGTRLDLRFACRQYTPEYENDLISFKKMVESELVYDV